MRNSGKQDVRFSIGFKLVAIITMLVLLSLGTITVLVSVFVSQDVQIAAEDNNFTVNQRSAAEAESTITAFRSNALVLLDTLVAAGFGDASRQAAILFFERYQDVAAVAVLSPGGGPPAQFLVNPRFFLSREIDSAAAESFITARQEAGERTLAGETLLLNAAPEFGAPVAALYFPWQDNSQGAVVFFSAEGLSETFGTGTNMSFMINSEGDVLIHPDYALVRAGANMANQDFIRNMRENTAQRTQTLYTEDGIQYFGAFTRLNIAGSAVITSIEYNKVFEGIAATTRRNAYLTAAVLFLSVLFIWFFSKSISGPLRSLAEAAQKIEGGTFEIDLASKSQDEIGLLTSSFRRMSAALGIFGRFTNREIAVRAMRGDIKPGGFPKHATVFFSDIRGFTEKSEQFTRVFGDEASDRIVHWLNEYFTHMVDCVEKTNGVVDKFIGDAVMAHWGTAYSAGSPAADAFNCVQSALMMRTCLVEMNKNRSVDDPGNPPIRIGCGINTGIVTAGQIGSDLRMEYTVIGDPVNLASRTEALNKPLGTDILITEDTWNLVGNDLITEEMPSVTVKGKAKPTRMFAVVNLKGQEGPQSLAEVRDLFGIEPPDISKVDTGEEEKKYEIGAG
ncbi:MAG: HAMP domain-containing protein [Treponema sp.]|jgi:adenylate cyclase|nr:HAMP domain-containing protein [Treponema sp.]